MKIEQKALRSRSDVLPERSLGVSRGLLVPDPIGVVTEIRYEVATMKVRLPRQGRSWVRVLSA